MPIGSLNRGSEIGARKGWLNTFQLAALIPGVSPADIATAIRNGVITREYTWQKKPGQPWLIHPIAVRRLVIAQRLPGNPPLALSGEFQDAVQKLGVLYGDGAAALQAEDLDYIRLQELIVALGEQLLALGIERGVRQVVQQHDPWHPMSRWKFLRPLAAKLGIIPR